MRFCWISCVLPLFVVFSGNSSALPNAATEAPLERNDTSSWYPFTFPLDDTNLDSIDLTGFLDAPAGKHGFLTVRDDGHFYFQDGTRARFFGTNVAGATAIPTKEQAPILAARLAKYGVNMLRIHAIDGRWAGNFIDYKKGDTRHLSAEMLDRLGFFIAELKKRGIYVYLDLLDYRRFQTADGVRDADQLQEPWQNCIKGASIFNERLIELQKEYAGQFLPYRNPHTGLRFVDDPAVAVVEITNENSIFYTHNTSLMLPSYTEELRQRWNRWLLEKFVTREALVRAWTNAKGECALLAEEDPAAGSVVLPMKHLYQDPDKARFVGEQSPVRVNAMVRFFFELERSYYGRMREHLESIGVKVPITGTNQTFCPASNYADAVNEFMSRNNYWLHPNVRAKPMFTFHNLPLVGSDLSATSNPIVEVASSAVAGKPMIVPEFNFPWPNEHRAECLPLMAAYACLQDWDGLLFYNYRPDRKQLEMFGSQSDPVRWGQFPAAALLFHRQDVSVAKNTVSISYSEDEIFTARPSHGRAKTSPYRHFAYLSKVRNVYATHQPGAVPGVDFKSPAAPDTGYTSDTGELNLNPARGLFAIRTARTKAAVGFLGQAGEIDLDGLVVHCRTPFAAIIVSSLDDRPVLRSRRLLVTAVARAENTGQTFDSNRSRVPEIGQLPVLVEPVDAEVRLPLSAAATLYPLDETGKRRQGIPADFDQGVCRLRLTDLRSPWCEVEAGSISDATRRVASIEALSRTLRNPQRRWLDNQRQAPSGTRLCTFTSKTVGQEVSYILYLPPGYESSGEQRYPVLYWLHGRGGTQFTGADFVVPYLDAAIASGEAPPMIAIMVNGLIDGFYSDSPDGQFPLESVIIKDLIPHVDSTYRTIAERGARAVQGYSMGGWGAAHLGFKYPDLFGVVCIDAGALLDADALRERHPDIFEQTFGTAENYLANHPRTLIEKNADKVRGRTFVHIGVGEKDQLLRVNQEYHELLTALQIEHEYEVVPGVAHFNRDYHRVLGAEGFAFYKEAFAGASAPDPSKKEERSVRVGSNPHWLEFRGKPILPIGDSVTQGWMECGANFDQRAYLEALAARGINVVLLWSYIGTSAEAQRQDPRIGYDAPEIWPWKGSPDERNFDLTAFNPAYFERLREFVQYADNRNIVVVITVQDGWPKTRFSCHPFNGALGNGPLTDRRQFVELADYNEEMPARYNPDWTRQQKNQYFQERFADRLAAELHDCGNVIFEMFNEGEWYDPAQRRLHEQHFLRFFRKRTTAPLVTNVDHIRSRDFGLRQDPAVDIISLHGKPWTGHFARFEKEFKAEPARVVFESEPVPSFGAPDAAPEDVVSLDILRAAVWERALSGSGWVAQNDASFGWDPKSAMAGQANLRDQAYNQIGHAARFFNQTGVEFWEMSPDSKLASTAVCLAEAGRAYVAYAPHSGDISVDLSATASQVNVKWINPRTGTEAAVEPVQGGDKGFFQAPGPGDWVLYLRQAESTKERRIE